ncbi:ABC transporter ATP-binding protein [Sphingomonas sp. G-3-2-10]|uniref:ABC transporter ATP-binding protein n=1 Tax=Sphingomonas sp. G-3-2-10 TaxID=2728838 RepID=UPI00146F80C8|nr:ABC transporter ATP-binding protein [Sphingomonas sp. G-3-2-10]NML06485.1 ABC transporter ATP-binding protein [Sphingomonas sp. G-3-2-10]
MDLIAQNLAVELGGRTVLRDVSAHLRPGRITAILGPNGSGKTTLIRSLAGLIEIDGGQVKLGERIIARVPDRERAKLIGYLPQDGVAHWNIGVRELVALGRLPHRAPFAGPSPEDAAEISAALAATDTMHLAGRRVQELSGGERARVLLARVLAGTPGWLLADEPLASLDPAHQFGMLDQLRGLAATGMGVAIVLHDLVQAARIADDVLILKDGEVVVFGQKKHALNPGTIRTAFQVEVSMIDLWDGTTVPVTTGRTLV